MKYLFLKYNNYYNRRIKKKDSLEAYVDAVPETSGEDPKPMKWAPTNEFNFNPGDYINTQIVINWDEKWNPDYLVCYEGNWRDNDIQHRWFIITSERTRKGQYIFSLRRDLIADDYNNISNHTCNIIRSDINPTNPLIFNREPFTYNQIKDGETFLYDETRCPWIVGYIPNGTHIQPDPIPSGEDFDLDLSTINHDSWQFAYLENSDIIVNPKINDTRVPISYENNWWIGGYTGTQCHQGPGWTSTDGSFQGLNHEGYRYSESDYNKCVKAARHNWINWNYINQKLSDMHPSYNQQTIINQINRFNGNKIRFRDGIYRIDVTSKGEKLFKEGQLDSNDGVEFWQHGVKDEITDYLLECFSTGMGGAGSLKHDDKCAYNYKCTIYTLTMTPVVSNKSISYSIPSGVNKLIDAPYTMFCMPYPNATASAPNINVEGHSISKEVIEKVYSDIISHSITGTGTDNLYDVQILPYCPVKFGKANYYSYSKTNYISFPKIASPDASWGEEEVWVKNIDYTEINLLNDNGQVIDVIGHIFFPKESSFKFTINRGFTEDGDARLSGIFSVEDKKIESETGFIRLCSPNYSGSFEMNLAKNDGLEAIDIMCTYKPYNPYIQVQPQFKSLYGRSFEDSRGLICSGDFSLPIINSAWVNYELTNKTYQQTFNREIQHMEVSQDIARQQQAVKTISGTVTAATSGAMTGAMMGGGAVGTAVGGAVAGGTSLAGGIIDYNNLVKQQKEDISYSKDMFNFNLQNIKALPNSLAKTSSLNANSKYVPFIERYTCTEEEKNLLKQFIEYNGMTAGFCGNITPSKFVQANIIKYEGQMDADEVNALNDELLKGVYFE